jgi:hypothetical protein
MLLASVVALSVAVAAGPRSVAHASTPPGGVTIYGDGLAAGWRSWSWGSSTNFGVASPVYAGSRSLSVQITSGWGALYLRADQAVTGTADMRLRFAARASQPGQRYLVRLVDSGGQSGTEVLLADVGGDPAADRWTVYDIPIAALGMVGRPIAGIILQDPFGQPLPPLYVDEVQFVTGG